MPRLRVVDAHIHIQPWKKVRPEALRLIQGSRPDAEELERMMYDPSPLLRRLDEEEIDWVVSVNYVSPDVMGFTFDVNAYAADYASRAGGRVVPIGSVHPKLTPDAEREMDEVIRLGIRGIKIHPSHQRCFPNEYRDGNRALEAIYRKAEESGLVLMVHTGTSIFPGARNVYADPIYCDDIAIDFPKLTIILAHGGRPLWMETATFLVRRHANVFMDVSSIPPQNLLRYFPKLEDLADKVLWGSDWPAPGVPGMRANADRFLALTLSDGARRKILFENTERIYGRQGVP